MSDFPVYYKIYADRDDMISIVCMQYFDEDDYHQDRFYRDGSGDPFRFDDEEEAIQFVNEKFHQEYIAEKFRRKTNNFWKERLINE